MGSKTTKESSGGDYLSAMHQYVIKFENGDYVANLRLTTHYINYDRTSDKEKASRLFNFDSKLVLKRLREKREKVEREEVEPHP